jgi:hypothetical protein
VRISSSTISARARSFRCCSSVCAAYSVAPKPATTPTSRKRTAYADPSTAQTFHTMASAATICTKSCGRTPHGSMLAVPMVMRLKSRIVVLVSPESIPETAVETQKKLMMPAAIQVVSTRGCGLPRAASVPSIASTSIPWMAKRIVRWVGWNWRSASVNRRLPPIRIASPERRRFPMRSSVSRPSAAVVGCCIWTNASLAHLGKRRQLASRGLGKTPRSPVHFLGIRPPDEGRTRAVDARAIRR